MSGKAKYPDDIHNKIADLVKNTTVVDATAIAERCGNIKTANVVLVGMLSKAIGMPPEEVEEAIRAIVPSKALQVNLDAFQEGRNLIA